MAKTHKVDIKDGDRVIRDIVRDKRKRKKEGKGRRKIRKREKLIDRQLRKYSFIYFCIIFIIKKKKEKKPPQLVCLLQISLENTTHQKDFLFFSTLLSKISTRSIKNILSHIGNSLIKLA